ncbi:hypothetical protein [Haloferula sp. BvORR071]|uniref:hypothetical protein n=1 Tax=Haloferula sp. BvORR071 TaxID=1396141 RepID=UPI00054FC35C|nr:hypothetical protein [Haloferula sp. BvORR071]
MLRIDSGMSKFFCNQCGASVESDDSFAPPDPTCPACRGEVASPAGEDSVPLTATVPPPLVIPPPQPTPGPYHASADIPGPSGRQPPSGSALFLRALFATLIAGSIAFAGLKFSIWKQEDNPGHLFSLWLGSTISMAVAGLAVSLVAALVMLAFKKSFGRSFAHSYSLATLLIAILACLGGLVGEAGQRQQRARETRQAKETAKSEEALKGMKEDRARMLAEINKGSSKGTDFHFESEEPKDAASSFRHLNQSLLNDSVAIRNEYLQAIDNAGVHRLLDRQRLAADEDLKESRAILARCAELVKDYKAKSRELLDSIPQLLDRYPIPAADKKEFLVGHYEVMPRKIADTEAPWNAEAKTLGILVELIDYLEETKTEWTVTDGKLLFQSDEGLAGFQAILKKLNEFAAKQREKEEKLLNEAQSKSKERKNDPENP